MFILAKLVFASYMPSELDKGMWFKQKIKDVVYGKIYEYDRLYELQHIPQDMDSYVQSNGFPVLPWIYIITANADNSADILAMPDQIGWWDEGSHTDDLRDVTMQDFNYILENEDGVLDIDVTDYINEDGVHMITPIIFMDKVTLRIPSDDDDEYEEEEEEEEYWDDMDDLTHNEPNQTDADHETE